MTDSDWVRKTLAGDRDAFGALVRRYRGMALGQAWHILKNWADACDAVQQAFVCAYTSLHTLRDRSKFGAWLRRIVVNECRTVARKRTATVPIEDAPQDALEAPSARERLETAELGDRIQRAIDALPEQQRLAFVLFYMDGMSCNDVGRFLSVSAGAVKVRLHRARTRLKKELSDMTEKALRRKHSATDLADLVRAVLPERVVEPIDLQRKTAADDTVVIYVDDAVLRLRGSAGRKLRMTGEKILFGETRNDAAARSTELVVGIERRRDLWNTSPYDGRRVCGVRRDEKQGLALLYGEASEVWRLATRDWRGDRAFKERIRGLLEGEVVLVLGAGNEVGAVAVTGDSIRHLQAPGATLARGGDWGFGPAAQLRLDLAVPPCRNVVVFSSSGISLDVEDITANLIVFGAMTEARIRNIHGDALLLGTAPKMLQKIAGNVWLTDDGDHRGVCWGKERIVRAGKTPVSRIAEIAGDLRVECRILNLNIDSVAGDIAVRNEFGRTRLSIAGTRPSSRTLKVESVSGPIALRFAPGILDRASVGISSESGAIDRSKCRPFEFNSNTPRSIYSGTVPLSKNKGIEVRTRTGEVRLVEGGA
ncbi:MAG: RNA polymerase sigma factor [Kiritimatiellaeota bacterium]|nr:RNA polymerase sigma factor [Kiritimatiellota bacterium]